MDTQQQVIAALTAMGRGDEALRDSQYSSATSHYLEAMRSANSLPKSEPFDLPAFTASCSAGLVLALARLGKQEQCLDLVGSVLSFFDRAGGMYPAEYGKWILAIISKGIALGELGRTSEATTQRERVKNMLQNSLAKEPGTLKWQTQINQSLEKLDDLITSGPPKRKSPWKFWR